jgi:virulence factor Mce-like protein
VVGAVAAGFGGGGGTRHLTAYFTRTIGLYKGNDVRILGVRVGQIDNITVVGTQVKVDLSYDGSYRLPADVGAVIVPPSVVSDRYVELTPAFTGGAALPDHAVLHTDRTQVPLEFDEIFRNLDTLDNALGPNGANRNGALSRLIDVSAANLTGNGTELNAALTEFSDAISTLAGSRGNLFATVRQLQAFTTTHANDDGGVRALNANLARVGTVLAAERTDLGNALANLATALRLVNDFVANNRTVLTTDIHKLAAVSTVLSREKEAITEIIDMAPTALANLSLAYDPRAMTLDTKDDAGNPFSNPTGKNGVLCQLFNVFCTGAAGTVRPGSYLNLLQVPR